MSAEDETYDIDFYGDDSGEDVLAQPDDRNNVQQDQQTTHNSAPASISQAPAVQPTQPPSQSLKRKAPDDEVVPQPHAQDERPLDAGAQISLKLSELQWWNTEEDLRHFCAQANAEAELVEISFAEHKINGKSKGEAYLEFKTPHAACMTKRMIEKANAELESKPDPTRSKIQAWYTAPGNPFKVREGQGKKDGVAGKYGQQGAYNSYGGNNNTRGNFGGRGRGGYNARGGGNTWSGQSNNSASNNFGNGMMNGYGNMGFTGTPGMMNPMAMMNSMMAGGFMGMQNMMGGRGGGNMMGRGGWNGMNQSGQQQGGYQSTWDNSNNKKPRTE